MAYPRQPFAVVPLSVGPAVLVKWPLLLAGVLCQARHWFEGTHGFTAVRVCAGRAAFTVVSLHLNPVPYGPSYITPKMTDAEIAAKESVRMARVTSLLRLLSETADPTIVGGDFNTLSHLDCVKGDCISVAPTSISDESPSYVRSVRIALRGPIQQENTVACYETITKLELHRHC